MSTNVAKRLVWNMNMRSNCDVTKNAHQTQMTTICHWMKPPPIKIFCVRHWYEVVQGRVRGVVVLASRIVSVSKVNVWLVFPFTYSCLACHTLILCSFWSEKRISTNGPLWSLLWSQFHRHGGTLVGLAPPNKSPSPPKLKYETPWGSGTFVKFECQAPPHKRKALLTTFWQRFCLKCNCWLLSQTVERSSKPGNVLLRVLN